MILQCLFLRVTLYIQSIYLRGECTLERAVGVIQYRGYRYNALCGHAVAHFTLHSLLTIGGHAAVKAFLEATGLASIATVATNSTVASVLTRVRTVTQTLFILHRSTEESLPPQAHESLYSLTYSVLNQESNCNTL